MFCVTRPQSIGTLLLYGLAVSCISCATPVEPGTANISGGGLEVVTENPPHGFFPHQLMYLLLQR